MSVVPLHPGHDQWWAISGEALWSALQNVASGRDPRETFRALYDESEHENVTSNRKDDGSE